MNRFAMLGVCMLVLGAVGCAQVDSPVPIGKDPVMLQGSEWNGTWASSEGTVIARVVDAAKGTVEIAWIEEESGEPVMKKKTLYIRQTGDWVFVNITDEDKPDRYLWARLKNDDGEAILWIPDVDKIKALVREGKLPGKVDDDRNVQLGTLSEEQTKRLTSDDNGVLYDWENPLVFRRMSEK